ncbi:MULTISPECIES: ion channel protein [unclassified Microbacterium]|uniref:ion channel protein n=1 Tax=unclassified Microbacterium TaxID=2609290 RepID=UPI0012F9C7FA|nr:ion channel protein [Microbacterium sp. MAH-37]MVQ43816.1 ion channel protein [Microbacterium sp. MAH-37]
MSHSSSIAGARRATQARKLLVMAVPAIAVGVGSALMLWALDMLSEGLEHVLWDALPAAFGFGPDNPFWVIGVLTLTGAAVGATVRYLPGHGGPDSAVGELDAEPPKLIALPSLALAVVLGLAGGVSLGPENPIIGINSALAVAVLARFAAKIPAKLAAVFAMSATIGALFGTPVAAALVLTGAIGAIKGEGALWDKLFLPLAAAASAAITMKLLGGNTLAFSLPPIGEADFFDAVVGVGIAICAALIVILAAVLLPIAHRLFHSLGSPLLFTTLGGALLGVLAVIGGPLTMFKGLNETGALLSDPGAYSAGQLALFAGVKLVALVIAAAAGFRGGRVFPVVFIGVALGLLAAALFPGIPLALAVACAALGATLVATHDGWIALFLAVALVGDITVLPLLCVIILPLWLVVTAAPELIVAPRKDEPATA